MFFIFLLNFYQAFHRHFIISKDNHLCPRHHLALVNHWTTSPSGGTQCLRLLVVRCLCRVPSMCPVVVAYTSSHGRRTAVRATRQYFHQCRPPQQRLPLNLLVNPSQMAIGSVSSSTLSHSSLSSVTLRPMDLPDGFHLALRRK